MDQSIVYLSWKSPAWAFKKRDKEFVRNVGAIVFLLLVILLFAREYGLMLAVVSVVFLIYVFSTVQPDDVSHKITSLGIETSDKFYPWESLKEFWFEEQWGQKKLIIVPVTGLRLIIVLHTVSEATVKDVLSRFVPYIDVPEKRLEDSAAKWLSKNVPLEKAS